MEKFVLNYRVIVEPDTRVGTNEKCFTAYCPTLGIADDGETIDEALKAIREGIQCYVEALVKDGEEVPSPDDLNEGVVSGGHYCTNFEATHFSIMKLPVDVKPKNLLRGLKKRGYLETHKVGSHIHLHHPDCHRT